MPRVAVTTLIFGLLAAHVAATQWKDVVARGTAMQKLTKCAMRCEAKNECSASLDQLSCEEACVTQCRCTLGHRRRMLNVSPDCRRDHRIGLLRMGAMMVQKRK